MLLEKAPELKEALDYLDAIRGAYTIKIEEYPHFEGKMKECHVAIFVPELKLFVHVNTYRWLNVFPMDVLKKDLPEVIRSCEHYYSC
jgi:hypothetical protein